MVDADSVSNLPNDSDRRSGVDMDWGRCEISLRSVDPRDDTNRESNYYPDFTPTTTSVEQNNTRDYKCPNCEGEFNSWTIETLSSEKHCPFCGLEQGEYDPDG